MADNVEEKPTVKDEPSEQQAQPQDGDLTILVEQLLQDMQQKFKNMSDQIIGRLDEMGRRVDELEHSIGDLMKQVNESDDTKASKK